MKTEVVSNRIDLRYESILLLYKNLRYTQGVLIRVLGQDGDPHDVGSGRVSI